MRVDPLNQTAISYLDKCDVFSEAINTSYDPTIVEIKLTNILKENPNDPLSHLYFGNFAYRIGDLEKAEKFYKETINLSNGSIAAAYFGMGMIYSQNHRIDAQEWFKKAVNLSHFNIQYLNNLAGAYDESRNYADASYWFYRTLLLNPAYLVPYLGYSNSLRCLGDLINAVKVQEQQVKMMEIDDTKNLKFNQGAMLCPINSHESIYLNTYDQKKYYYYYNIALTYYLLGEENKTRESIQKANVLTLDVDSKSNVKRILNYDVENLQKEQPNLINKTTEFRNKYLEPNQISI